MLNGCEKQEYGNKTFMTSDKQDNNQGIYRHDGENLPEHSGHDSSVIAEQQVRLYWRANIMLLLKLLTVWFVVSFGFAILLREWLNEFQFFGFKLGFWFGQQGAIYVFVILIFVYAWRMKQIDREFGVDDDNNDGGGQ